MSFIAQPGSQIINTTYADLAALITAGSLVPGALYRFAFQTKHYIVDFYWTQYLDSIITGTVENLIVRAASKTELDPEAISESWPFDKIIYDWNPANWLDDISFADVTTEPLTPTIVPGFQGVIVERHDYKQNNHFIGDFRNCRSRRYAFDVADWNIATAYTRGEWVRYTDSYLYRCIKENTGNAPGEPSIYWARLVNETLNLHQAAYPDVYQYYPAGTDLTVDPLNFFDYLMFEPGVDGSSYETQVFNNNFIGQVDKFSGGLSTATILSNNVFFLKNLGINVSGNRVSKGFVFNTINSTFGHNEIYANVFQNIFDEGFEFNQVGVSFFDNIVSYSCKDNVFDSGNSSNTLGGGFQKNTCGAYFAKNLFGVNATNNKFDSDISGILAGNNFQMNNLESFFAMANAAVSAIINSDFQSNRGGFRFGVFGTTDFSAATLVYLSVSKTLQIDTTDAKRLYILEAAGLNYYAATA